MLVVLGIEVEAAEPAVPKVTRLVAAAMRLVEVVVQLLVLAGLPMDRQWLVQEVLVPVQAELVQQQMDQKMREK